MCRGVIYNHETGELLARPFPKFFNWDEMGQFYPPAGPVLRMEKLDGSLGILYPIHEWHGVGSVSTHWRIATRGSFHSEQAEWATRFFNQYFAEFNDRIWPQPDETYLFEIIYPENRIVVDYGEFEGLVLLDVIRNEDGSSDTDEFDDFFWPDKVTRTPMTEFNSRHQGDIPEGEEGFVYLWPVRGNRVKMKSAEYIELHKLVTGLNSKTIWEALCQGKTVDQIKLKLPEEFHVWIDEEAAKIQIEATKTLTKVYRAVDEIEAAAHMRIDMMLRAEFAAYAKKYGSLAKYLFMVVDNKPIYPVALREAKPQREATLVSEV